MQQVTLAYRWNEPKTAGEKDSPASVIFGPQPNALVNVPNYDAPRAMYRMSERDDEKTYYLEQNFTSQGMKDIYAFAVLHGPLMLSEFGFIAHQLLWKVREFHRKNLILKYLAPQFILVTEGFTRGMPKIELCNVETMLLVDPETFENTKALSGVNLLFLAPELYAEDVNDPKVDIWSVGVILYLLVTGGVH